MSHECGKTDELSFNIGETINGYKLVQKIDEGAFGQVFKVSKDEKTFYAMKLESNKMAGGSAIKLEISVLTSLTSDVFPLYITGGKKILYHYLVLELLGPNLNVLKAKIKDEVFSEGTWSRVGIQCLYALKVLHNHGFLHRDIKPSNFAIGLNTNNSARSRRILLFDFGLARKFIVKEFVKAKTQVVAMKSAEATNTSRTMKGEKQQNSNSFKLMKEAKSMVEKTCGKIKKPGKSYEENRMDSQEVVARTTRERFVFRIARPRTDFRGTYQYASPNAHLLIELGRHDDIWSLMYMIAELFVDLPWFTNEELPVDEMKKQSPLLRIFTEPKKPNRFTAEMNKMLEEIQKNLEDCDYYDYPNYDLVYKFLLCVMKASKVSWATPYDWEVADQISEKTLKDVIKRAGADGFPWESPGDFFKRDKWKFVKRPPKDLHQSTGLADSAPKVPQKKKPAVGTSEPKSKMERRNNKKKPKDCKPSKEENSCVDDKIGKREGKTLESLKSFENAKNR